MEVRVVNVKDTCFGEYIGRAFQGRAASPLANPFRIGGDGSREQVIAKYAQWLWNRVLKKDTTVIDEGKRLMRLAHRPQGVSLLCWCAPLPCHGDVIKRWLEWMEETS